MSEFDAQGRVAKLSVGEFARFLDEAAGSSGTAESWRLEAGRIWHEELRRRTAAISPNCRFEVPAQGAIKAEGWIINLEGRIDQLDTISGVTVLREIKTVQGRLPDESESLGPAWRHAWVQAATYAILLGLAEPPRVELVLVEIGSGLIRRVSLPEPPLPVVTAHAGAVASLLEKRRAARAALLGPPPSPPFEKWREAQIEGFEALAAACGVHTRVAFSAPTGFGKTAAALHAAIRALRSGAVDRVIHLTARNSTQPAVAAEAARQLRLAGAPEDVLLLRSREDHCINEVYHCHPERCRHLAEMRERWPHGIFGPASDGRAMWTVDTAKEEGRRARVCPHELTRAALPWRHVWVADCSYLVSPRHTGFLRNLPGYDPSRTFLVVDEAHNLASRAADALGFEADATRAAEVAGLLDFRRIDARWRDLWAEWCNWLAGLAKTDCLPPDEEHALRRLSALAAALLPQSPPDSLELGVATAEELKELARLSLLLTDGMPRLIWAPRTGSLRIHCLDASVAVSRALAPFARVILQSATLPPMDVFSASIGMDPDCLFRVEAQAPWRNGACRVAVDERVDTRYSHRQRHLPETAATLARIHEHDGAAVVAFLPGFTYARQVEEALNEAHPKRVVVQPRDATPAELAEFLDTHLLTHDILLLVLGSSLSEGVDLLGGRVQTAVIVGPALPEVNPVQEARLSALAHLGRTEAFRRTYIVPGMTRVNQAIGRLIRAPGQQVRVLLHCRRFSDHAHASLLDPSCQFFEVVRNRDDLDRWLDNTLV
jgi:Rad3-related DNA helicase